MRFLRSHKPNKSTRASKVEKVPPEIEEKMQKDPLKHGHYFDLWLAHGENWGKVVVFEKSYLKTSTNSRTKECWVTEDQLLDYLKNAQVVSAILASKSEAAKTKRPHPDAPNEPAATQYFCCVEESVMRGQEYGQEQGVAFSAQLDHQSGAQVLPHAMPKKSSRGLDEACFQSRTQSSRRQRKKKSGR